MRLPRKGAPSEVRMRRPEFRYESYRSREKDDQPHIEEVCDYEERRRKNTHRIQRVAPPPGSDAGVADAEPQNDKKPEENGEFVPGTEGVPCRRRNDTAETEIRNRYMNDLDTHEEKNADGQTLKRFYAGAAGAGKDERRKDEPRIQDERKRKCVLLDPISHKRFLCGPRKRDGKYVRNRDKQPRGENKTFRQTHAVVAIISNAMMRTIFACIVEIHRTGMKKTGKSVTRNTMLHSAILSNIAAVLMGRWYHILQNPP